MEVLLESLAGCSGHFEIVSGSPHKRRKMVATLFIE